MTRFIPLFPRYSFLNIYFVPFYFVSYPRFWCRICSELLVVLMSSCRFLPFQENFASSKPWTDPEGLLSLSEPQRAKLLG